MEGREAALIGFPPICCFRVGCDVFGEGCGCGAVLA